MTTKGIVMELTKEESLALEELLHREVHKETTRLVKQITIDSLMGKGLVIGIKSGKMPVFRPSPSGKQWLESLKTQNEIPQQKDCG